MAEQRAVPIDKDAVPYRFDIQLAGEVFTFEVHYNYRFDYYTIHLEKDNERVVDGEKVVYGRKLFSGLNDARLPKVDILPTDVAGDETRAGKEQMSETVFLFVSEASA